MPDPEPVTPAPLFRDPLFDGAADPTLVWNPGRKAWWMLYTQRRARLDLPGVVWCHGCGIGVAESGDGGMSWRYLGTLELEQPDEGGSFWAPDLVRDDDGGFHLFVSYVPGDPDEKAHWGGERHILHYRSRDLWDWNPAGRVPLSSDHCIDPTLFRLPDGTWRMWFKDEAHGSDTLAVDSADLESWRPAPDPGVSKLSGEAPKVFRFKGSHWMLKDPNSGLDVYRSDDLENWVYQGKILREPGVRNDDGSIGKHPDVVVCGERAYVIYFTHPDGQDFPLKNGRMRMSAKRSSIQAAELEVVDGRLSCDRDKPFRIRLEADKSGK